MIYPVRECASRMTTGLIVDEQAFGAWHQASKWKSDERTPKAKSDLWVSGCTTDQLVPLGRATLVRVSAVHQRAIKFVPLFSGSFKHNEILVCSGSVLASACGHQNKIK